MNTPPVSQKSSGGRPQVTLASKSKLASQGSNQVVAAPPSEQQVKSEATPRVAIGVADTTRNTERFFIIALFFTMVVVGVAAWLTDGRVFRIPGEILNQFEPPPESFRNATNNCQVESNRNSPYCQERAAQTESNWRAVGKAKTGNAFRLNQVKKR